MRVPVQAMGVTVASGVSIGLVQLPEHARSVDDAMVAADLAPHQTGDAEDMKAAHHCPAFSNEKPRYARGNPGFLVGVGEEEFLEEAAFVGQVS